MTARVRRIISRRIALALSTALAAVAILLAGSAGAEAPPAGGGTALIMVTSPTCPWCEAFDEEVGSLYDRTVEAGIYPLVRVDIHAAMPPGFDSVEGANLTPTFIFVQDGSEVGRIIGYPGEELFWWRMSEFVPTPGT